MTTPAPPALTLRDAAKLLGVTPQRINQMLRDEVLEGPTHDGPRAPKDAERVWVSSIVDYVEKRGTRASTSGPQSGSAPSEFTYRLDQLQRQVAELAKAQRAGEGLASRERAARQAAHQLKVQADILRDKAKDRDARIGELEVENAKLRAQLEVAKAAATTGESQLKELGDVITTLLAPDAIGES